MPVTRATRWRQRSVQITRKGALEFDPWDGDEPDENVNVQALHLKASQPLKPVIKQPSSPTSVASTLDASSMLPDGEIKPLNLPGAWIVVGKRGKPDLHRVKMYDEPMQAPTKKKKKRAKKTETIAEDEPLADVLLLEEAASSSVCLRALDRSIVQRGKLVTRAKEARHWAGYQRAKQRKREALHELIAALTCDPTERAAPAPTAERPTKDHKANSSKDKARRRARSAAAAARCLLHDEGEGAIANIAEEAQTEVKRAAKAKHVAKEATPRQVEPGDDHGDELALLVGLSAATGTAITPVPPGQPSNLAGEPNEASPSESVKRKSEKGSQCSVM